MHYGTFIVDKYFLLLPFTLTDYNHSHNYLQPWLTASDWFLLGSSDSFGLRALKIFTAVRSDHKLLHGHRLSLQENLAWRNWIWRAEPVSQPAGPGSLILKFNTWVRHTGWNTQTLTFICKKVISGVTFFYVQKWNTACSVNAVDAQWLLMDTKTFTSMNYNLHP